MRLVRHRNKLSYGWWCSYPSCSISLRRFFVGLIGEEQRFRHYYRRYAGMTVASIRDIEPEPAGYLPHIKDEDEPAIEQKVEEPEEPKTLLEQVSDALKTHQITCTKKAVAKQFRLSAEEVDKVFEELAELGLVGKKANHHYHWIGQAEAA